MTDQVLENKTGKIAIVTGGSRGLGRNIALNLAKTGVDLIITYHSNRAEADAVTAAIADLGRKAVAVRLDTGDSGSFAGFATQVQEALAKEWNRTTFDHLVNNAGIHRVGTIGAITGADLDLLYNIHVKGVLLLTQQLLPMLADGGRIINISSGLARFTIPGNGAYAAMKGAVEVLTRYMAKELAVRGITVNTVAPGAIETDFGNGAVRDNPDYNRAVAAVTALGRAGLPDDIGPMVAALLSDANRWVTGQRIEVSGGMNL